MKSVGVVATVAVAALGAAAAGLVVVSLPDIKRYIRMSRM